MIGSNLSHYRIVSELGRGGMGIVYLAEDTKLDRQVAIKVLPSSALASDDDRARFYREAKAAAALNHPNIAQIYQIDEAVPSDAPHGTQPSPFIAMEYIDGEPLETRIKRGPLKLPEAVRLATQIAGALSAAHESGIVHRDIKSANVMLTSKGDAKVLDFGLALTAASTKLTRMGSTLGTVAYMSPEQARGEEVDSRTDLWALGVVLYEMIAGRNPFGGDYEQAVVYSILNAEPEPLTALRTGVPMELERIVTKALQKDRARRYQTSADLVADLRGVDASGTTQLSGDAAAAGHASSVRQGAAGAEDGPDRRRHLLAFGVIALVVGLVSGLAGWWLKPDPPERPLDLVIRMDELEENFRRYGAGKRAVGISPDGRLVAFRGATASGVGLFIADLTSGAEPELLFDGYADLPTFSPRGDWIAFVGSSSIHKVRVIGGEPLEIVSDVPDIPSFSWESDGYIYYPPDYARGILRIPENGGVPEEVAVVRTDLGEIGLTNPDLMPGGRTLVVGAYGYQGYEIKLIDLEGGDRTTIERGHAPVFRDGHLFFSQGPRLLRARLRGQTVGKPVLIAEPVSTAGSLLSSQYAISASGDLVFVSGSHTWGRLMEIRRWDGSREAVSGAPDAVTGVDISSDGRYFALAAHPTTTQDPDVYLFEPDRRDLRQLTVTSTYETNPTFGPDGQTVYFSSEREGSADIYRIGPDGREKLVYSDSTAKYVSDVSQDGKTLFFHGRGIFALGLEALKPERIVPGGGVPQDAVVSADGRLVAYQSLESGQSEVYVVDFPGSGRARVRITENGGESPSFSGSGRDLYWLKGTDLMKASISDTGDRIGDPEVVLRDMGSLYHLLPDGSGVIVLAQPRPPRLRFIRGGVMD